MYVCHCVNVHMHTYVYVCVYIGIGVHPDGTRVYVADRGNDRVAVFDLDGACLNLIGSGTGQAPRFLQVGVCLSDVCMYTYIYKITYIYACTFFSICVYVYACVAFSLASAPPTRPALCRYICVYVHLNIYIHLYMYVCICLCTSTYIDSYVSILMCICVCLYTWINIYT